MKGEKRMAEMCINCFKKEYGLEFKEDRFLTKPGQCEKCGRQTECVVFIKRGEEDLKD